MQDCIGFPDVRQEFISQTFAFAGSFDQSGDVNDLHSGGDYSLRMHQFCQFV